MMNKLKFKKPALFWREALPIGNGYNGVMIYGGKNREKLSFNDGTLWSGYPKNQDNPESLKYLDEVRSLVFEGKNAEADKLCMEKLCGAYSEGYLPFGDLNITFSRRSGEYSRELDFNTAVHTVKNGTSKREMFCSYPDKITVLNLSDVEPFSLTITAESKLQSCTECDGALNLCGNAPDYVAPNYLRSEKHPVHYDEGKGMSFCLRCEVETDGQPYIYNGKIRIGGAYNVTLYIAAATGFKGYNEMPETSRRYALDLCKEKLKNAGRNYAALKNRHIDDFESVYGKQSLSLGKEYSGFSDELYKSAKRGEVKPEMCELLYNYGRYLIASGSRSGSQALNLQGIWNKSVRPPWSGNFTANINVEMNYWSVSRSNLCGCVEPYIDLAYNILQHGKSTAKVNYGCKGSCCNHNVDIWCKTAPVQGTPAYMYAPLCGAWLSNEVYKHYKNGNLTQYKEKVCEIVRLSAEFINDYLVLHDGFYVTAPSASPEISFISGSGQATLDYASTFEMSIVRQTFSDYLELFDNSLAQSIKEKMPLLYPLKNRSIGITEWHKDYEVSDKGHRHFSPLYGFYPANTIKYYENPEQTDWVRKLFFYRINNSTQYIGWSAAWAIALSGRLHDGKTAKRIIDGMLSHSVFPNYFCMHPPFLFQIDGNLGFVAGVNELLLYEENGVVDLLPALPDNWKNGEIKGMIVNGAEISFKWKNHRVTEINCSRPLTVRALKLSDNPELSENITLKA